MFVEKASGAQRDRPELKAALDYMRDGDTLVVWKLDRLARSMKQLIETVEGLEEVDRHRDNVPIEMPSSADKRFSDWLWGGSIFAITDAFRSVEYATGRPLLRPPRRVQFSTDDQATTILTEGAPRH